MSYFKLRRGRIIIGAFAAFAALAISFPSIDIAISRLFFDGVAFPHDRWWQELQADGLNAFLGVAMVAVLVVYAWNKLLKQVVLELDGRKVAYLFLVLIIGAGLIVNAGLKNQMGRARPRDVAEFNGAHDFTPAFVKSNECRTNCSFSSGDAAGGFFTIALVMALRRRRAWFVAAGVFGAVISISRLASGAHFFSDTVTSFFVMLLVSDVLYHYLFELQPHAVSLTAPEPAALTSMTRL
jgi:lipid A 4'-phosphatase